MINAPMKTKLAWHCRRGMLELDLILQRFIKTHLDLLSSQEINAFDTLLGCTDPELYAWLMGYEEPIDKELKEIVIIIRNNN